ncbi:MAG: response regulator transcription factor [Flavisolibacter sp.]
MKHTVIAFGLLFFSVLILYQLAKFSSFQSSWPSGTWIAGFSILFLFIGIFLSRKFQKEKIIEKEVIVEKEKIVEKEIFPSKEPFAVNTRILKQLHISKREYEVLQLIGQGLSNQQIGEVMFVSENTVKKHITSLFLKLDVERRTEAVRKAREIHIIN